MVIRKERIDKMKYKIHFDKFIQHLDQRLKKGYHEYGDKSFDRSSNSLLNEIQEELVDVAGWAEILYSRWYTRLDISERAGA